MKYVNCNLCSSSEYTVVGTKGRHNIPVRNVVCHNCGLVYVNPMPSKDELKSFYEIEYRKIYSGSNYPNNEFLNIAQYDAKERYDFAEKYISEGSQVLEIGCGTGHFLNMIRSNKRAKVWGVEPGPFGEYGRKIFHLEISDKFIDDLQYPEKCFDIIVLWHVIEHMKNPFKVLETLRKYLKPEGLLLLELPNLRRYCSEVRGNGIDTNFFQNAHLFSFTVNTISLMLRKNGFKIIELDTKSSKWKHMFVVARPNYDSTSSVCYLREGDNWKDIQKLIQICRNVNDYKYRGMYKIVRNKISGIIRTTRNIVKR